jgi:hypothetical protein
MAFDRYAPVYPSGGIILLKRLHRFFLGFYGACEARSRENTPIFELLSQNPLRRRDLPVHPDVLGKRAITL